MLHFIERTSKSVENVRIVFICQMLTKNHITLTTVDANPTRQFELFMWGTYPASLRNVSVLLKHPLMPEILHIGVSEVFLHQWKLESCHMTFIVSVRLKTKQHSVYSQPYLFHTKRRQCVLTSERYLLCPPSTKWGYIALHMSFGRLVRQSIDKPCLINN